MTVYRIDAITSWKKVHVQQNVFDEHVIGFHRHNRPHRRKSNVDVLDGDVIGKHCPNGYRSLRFLYIGVVPRFAIGRTIESTSVDCSAAVNCEVGAAFGVKVSATAVQKLVVGSGWRLFGKVRAVK